MRSTPTIMAGALVLLTIVQAPGFLNAQEEPCLLCHGEVTLTTERDGQAVSLYIDGAEFAESIHGGNGCVSCHPDAASEDFVHETDLAAVDCSLCHPDASERFQKSLHGEALQQGKYLAPNCASCHGKHDIRPSADKKSRTYVMNIPALCGSCHKEGTPVSKLQTLEQHHVLEDYSQSIHGDGLFRRGLVVTAVCTSCHSSHDILPHENPASTINRNNIAGTCLKCHTEIERVHRKVIRGELWEKKPHEIPSCIDCHQPHKVRRVFYQETFPDSRCLSCHGDEALTETRAGQTVPAFVDAGELERSAHANESCIKCHTNISEAKDPVCLDSGRVDCSMCHAEQVDEYQASYHGTNHAAGNTNAPYCNDCHGVHDVQSKKDVASPIFSRNIPDLCGRCHREGQKAAVAYKGVEHDIIENYSMSIHGKGLLQSGLLVTATCVDCHTAHRELPAVDPLSTVNKHNIAATCAQCHLGIYEEFKNSIHSPDVTETDEDLPACNDCHLSHTIKRVDLDDFRQGILDQCGKCHLEVAETYFETFHGKVSKLGSVKTARCYDCHGAHNILPVSNPKSTLSRANSVETCKRCHPQSNRQFVGYLTHATHHNKSKYPYLYYTFWFMSFLLIGTFGVFGLHTVMWLPRAIHERRENNRAARADEHARPSARAEAYVQRFDPFSRFLHLLVILSFLSLAVTGITIKFSGVSFFQTLSKLMGGYAVTGFVHRVAAIVTFAYFFLHFGYLARRKRRQRLSLKEMLTGDDTILFGKRDVIEFWQTMKWFLGVGPRPQYGRWTYWEKFDYFAVMWGVSVIGGSGLLLWFPAFFTRIGMPGWLINVATIVHSDEALLAAGFIFTIHFFNTHFRPDKFPMDPVIFTGCVPLEELKQDRPREYSRLMKSRDIRKRLVTPPPPWFQQAAKIFGLTCLTIGLMVIVSIIWAMLFFYR